MKTSTPTVRAEKSKLLPPLQCWFAAGILIAATLAAYWNSLAVPLIFDDVPAIVDNPTIHGFWTAWSPPTAGGLVVDGRPVLNFSLAVSYALSGNQVWGYHLLNVAIHGMAGIVLFGLLRRTLALPSFAPRFESASEYLALAIALLWILHPLQTEAVTYIVQRAESLMGLCFLLTLYAAVRGAASPEPGRWFIFYIGACMAGMATKESMAAAPVLVLLYDRTFLSGSFTRALSMRRWLYVGLAGTWVLLGCLVASTHGRGGTAGFETTVSWSAYALTQLQAITHYLRLTLWPNPLVFDYGNAVVTAPAEILPSAVIIAALVTGTLIALWRNSPVGFLGAWFFAILAPSSSVVPVATQTIAEHRMYLPLAAIVALFVFGVHMLGGRRSFPFLCVIAAVFGWLTFQRNRDYRDELTLWRDTVEKWPANSRAHNNLGKELLLAGQSAEAVNELTAALRLRPDYAKAHNNLGVALVQLGRVPEAIGHYETALRLNPHDGETNHNLGDALVRSGRLAEAEIYYAVALRTQPAFAAAQANNLGSVLLQAGQTRRAVDELTSALRLQPDFPEAHNNLGNALLQLGQPAAAIEHYATAIRLRPNDANTHFNLGNVFLELGRLIDAQKQYREALRLEPNLVEAHNNLGTVFFRLGQTKEAVEQYREALRLKPDYTQARENLAMIETVTK